MSIILCNKCDNHYLSTESQCPNCATPFSRRTSKAGLATAVLLGLSLTACGDKGDDTGDTADTADTQIPDTADQALYGVPDTGFAPEYGVEMVDNDADGWDAEIDCNDEDANTFPGSAENDSTTDCMTDADGDGYGDANAASPIIAGSDCDDSNPDINPGAEDPALDCNDATE